jgi:hypothetical protein
MRGSDVDGIEEAMTDLELLVVLKTITVSEQLEVLEVGSKTIREGLNIKTDLQIAAEKMQAYYAKGSNLATFTDDNSDCHSTNFSFTQNLRPICTPLKM